MMRLKLFYDQGQEMLNFVSCEIVHFTPISLPI